MYLCVHLYIMSSVNWALLVSALFTQIVISLEAQIQLCSYRPLLLKHKHPCEHVDHYHYAYPLNPSGCIILCVKISHQSRHELQSDVFYRTLHALYLQIYKVFCILFHLCTEFTLKFAFVCWGSDLKIQMSIPPSWHRMCGYIYIILAALSLLNILTTTTAVYDN